MKLPIIKDRDLVIMCIILVGLMIFGIGIAHAEDIFSPVPDDQLRQMKTPPD